MGDEVGRHDEHDNAPYPQSAANRICRAAALPDLMGIAELPRNGPAGGESGKRIKLAGERLNPSVGFGCTRSVDDLSSREALVQAQAASTEFASFDAAVAPHIRVLVAIAARLVGVDDAADVVQEALLRAWKRWSTFDSERGSLRAWLAAITVDRARRHHRHRLPRAAPHEPGDLPEESAHERDQTERLVIEALVRTLPRRQREVIVLFYLADLSVEQTAAALGLRPGSVKAHLAAARARLRSALEKS